MTLRLDYCCATNIFALYVNIIIDQQSVMIGSYYRISSPISQSQLKAETLKVGDLPTDSCCPPEKVKPLSISRK